MIQISQLKLPLGHTEQELKKKITKILRIQEAEFISYEIIRRSVDARKKPDLFFVYTVWVSVKNEGAAVKRAKSRDVSRVALPSYQVPVPGCEPLKERPVIVGSGPAGLFCGLILARKGYCPLILERGKSVDERVEDVEAFWRGGKLLPDSNVQFGEGGAGTFSDGKLNTLVKDPEGRGRFVLKTFVEAGADPDILYMQKPHVGTDVLRGVVKHIREEIVSLGGAFRFQAKVTDFMVEGGSSGNGTVGSGSAGNSLIENSRLTGVILEDGTCISAQAVVLAIGHSARDTFELLVKKGVPMAAKAFAMGLRIEHPQALVELARYGQHSHEGLLPAADYKVTHRAKNGRGVYSFCMCPGGYVVNASSEPDRLAVNGMSYRARDGKNANSALIVTVTPEDFWKEFPEEGILGGMRMQQRLETYAYGLCGGKIPVQLLGDFVKGQDSRALGEITPQMKGAWDFGRLSDILPDYMREALIEGVYAFDRQIPGFAREDALFSGVESRTSSPVKILRDGNCESAIRGLYPCGEGAGYAGGIVSAAMDGCRVAERIIERFQSKAAHSLK